MTALSDHYDRRVSEKIEIAFVLELGFKGQAAPFKGTLTEIMPFHILLPLQMSEKCSPSRCIKEVLLLCQVQLSSVRLKGFKIVRFLMFSYVIISFILLLLVICSFIKKST